MTRNPHSEFLKYHGFTEVDTPTKQESDMQSLRSEIAEVKLTLLQVLQELRKLNT